MKKQHLEGYLSTSLKARNDLWYMKLQVMPLAHKQTPADYIVLSKDNKYLIECKECKNEIFNFSRLTQEHELVQFKNKFSNNNSYIMLMFWKERLKNSDIYLIPIIAYLIYKKKSNKKSINLNELHKRFMIYKCNIDENNLIVLRDIK